MDRTKIPANPDDQLSLKEVIMMYPESFAKQFLPGHVTGVSSVKVEWETVYIKSNVRLLHRRKYGKSVLTTVDRKKAEVWRQNAALYGFMYDGMKK